MSYEDQSHRFAITGEDPDGHPRTIILWRETDLVNGKVVRRVHVTLDATTVTETILTRGEAVEVAEAILAAAWLSPAALLRDRRGGYVFTSKAPLAGRTRRCDARAGSSIQRTTSTSPSNSTCNASGSKTMGSDGSCRWTPRGGCATS